ncbi:MAG: hypothetical protein EBT99_14110 [Betaproteobacteria bacterium]|nr:hypothetical protein [Betaproteobacteria bacterium]NBT81948.1 hypothetical protein [Betaproteobacteria bacterium]
MSKPLAGSARLLLGTWCTSIDWAEAKPAVALFDIKYSINKFIDHLRSLPMSAEALSDRSDCLSLVDTSSELKQTLGGLTN